MKYLWRSEPDVAFSGSIDALLELSARDEADVLLPATRSREEQPHYPLECSLLWQPLTLQKQAKAVHRIITLYPYSQS